MRDGKNINFTRLFKERFWFIKKNGFIATIFLGVRLIEYISQSLHKVNDEQLKKCLRSNQTILSDEPRSLAKSKKVLY